MSATLQEIEQRLAILEHEVGLLRQDLQGPPAEETPAQRGARLLREARDSQPAITATVAKAFAEMGITAEPVGPEELRRMMAECGIKAEDNEFSREIAAMREE